MDFSVILSHPDKEEIISKLLTGTDPRDVAQWLKIKYQEKTQSHLRLPLKTLQEFSKSEYVNIYHKLEHDIQVVKENPAGLDKKMAASLLNNKTYQERLNELADQKIDIDKILKGTMMMIQDRAIQIFDKIQENPSNLTKADYTAIKWIEQLLSSVEKYDKYINKSPDQVIQHNYTIQYVDQQTAALQECIKEVISEVLDNDTAMRFIDRLTEKLSKLKPPAEPKSATIEQQLQEAKILQEHVSNMESQ